MSIQSVKNISIAVPRHSLTNPTKTEDGRD